MLALVLALLLLLVSGWLAAPSSPAPEVRPSPSTVAPLRGDGAAVEYADAALHVWVRSLRRARHVTSWPPVAFDAVWPAADDPQWDLSALDGYDTPDALRVMSDPRYDYHRPPSAFARAGAEGFVGPAAELPSPEVALVSLYATWIDAELRYDEQWGAFKGRRLPEGETWESISDDLRAQLDEAPERPVQDVDALVHLADEVVARWPDHPVADHARFALLRAELPRGGPPADPVSLAAALDAIADPIVQEQAAVYLTRLRFEPVEPALAALIDRVERVPVRDAVSELRVSTWALNRAVALEDWDRARRWSDRLRDTLDAECVRPEPDRRLQCDTRAYELRDVTARLVALGLASPRTWEEALSAEVWRCHLEVAPQLGTSRTSAVWAEDRWTFGPWDVATATTRCVEEVRTTDLVPERPTRVRLTVEGSP